MCPWAIRGPAGEPQPASLAPTRGHERYPRHHRLTDFAHAAPSDDRTKGAKTAIALLCDKSSAIGAKMKSCG